MPRHVAQGLATDFKSSFLSFEKDQELILRKLFIENKPYSDRLKRLLVINTPDCLDETKKQHRDVIDKMDLAALKEQQYITVVPRVASKEFDEIKSRIILEFSDVNPSKNPEYRDLFISFTIVCHFDAWELDDYKLRPQQIAGYIDGILNNAKLSGIGTLNFWAASQFVMNEYLGGVVLQYVATHELQEDMNDEIVDNPNLTLY